MMYHMTYISCIEENIRSHSEDRESYISDLLYRYGTHTLNNKAAVLCTLLSAYDTLCLSTLHRYIDLPEMEKACRTLDAPRYIKQIQDKLLYVKRPNKINKLHHMLHITRALLHNSGYILHRELIISWIKSIPPEALQYKAFFFGKKGSALWRSLCDIVHPHKEDFSVPWFLSFCYGEIAPEDSLVYIMHIMNNDNFQELYKQYRMPYSLIRLARGIQDNLNTCNKETLICHEPLRTVVWYWSELSCLYGEHILEARLRSATDEQLATIKYGNLLNTSSMSAGLQAAFNS